MSRSNLVINTLVFAGSVPFIGLLLLQWVQLLPDLDSRQLFNSYALVILSFLCGSHWGAGIVGSSRLAPVFFVITNVLVLLLWMTHQWLSTAVFQVVVLVELGLLLAMDHWLRRAGLLSQWYMDTRMRITVVVAACVMTALAA
jgi:hypothetical protein